MGKLSLSETPVDRFQSPEIIDHRVQVMDATGSVATAITELLTAAHRAQAYRLTKSRESSDQKDRIYHKDPTWTQGLISAAKSVVSLIQQLVKASSGGNTSPSFLCFFLLLDIYNLSRLFSHSIS